MRALTLLAQPQRNSNTQVLLTQKHAEAWQAFCCVCPMRIYLLIHSFQKGHDDVNAVTKLHRCHLEIWNETQFCAETRQYWLFIAKHLDLGECSEFSHDAHTADQHAVMVWVFGLVVYCFILVNVSSCIMFNIPLPVFVLLFLVLLFLPHECKCVSFLLSLFLHQSCICSPSCFCSLSLSGFFFVFCIYVFSWILLCCFLSPDIHCLHFDKCLNKSHFGFHAACPTVSAFGFLSFCKP